MENSTQNIDKKLPSSNPVVSVSIITYNHEKFIAQALDSVLMQEVDFEYEIIVGDDCSSDKTPEILKEYQQKHPDKIHLILHQKRYDNIPGRINNTTNLYNCSGKYVAMLDGDDYWFHKNKLQTQVDFLEKNPDFHITFHDALVVHEDNARPPYRRSRVNFPFLLEKQEYDHFDVAEGWFMPTSSLVFRNFFDEELPEWFWDIYSADYALLLMNTQRGKARYFNDIVSVRRMSAGSFTQTFGFSLIQNATRIKELKLFGEHFPAVAQSATFGERMAVVYRAQAKLHKDQRDVVPTLRLYWKIYRLDPDFAKRRTRAKMKSWLRRKGLWRE